jgi:hypothetical protein
VKKAKTDALDKSVRVGQTGYDKEDLKKNAVEEFQEKMSGQMSAADRKNQMAVLSNTLTPEDYKKAQEDGLYVTIGEDIDRAYMDEIKKLTVTDKIKAQLANAGVDVSNMGGSLTKEQLEEIGGSLAAANRLEKYFQASDVPPTEENMTEGMEALGQADELQPLSKGAIKYMLDNHLSPSIANFYTAEFSGSMAYEPSEEEIDFDALKDQIERTIPQPEKK